MRRFSFPKLPRWVWIALIAALPVVYLAREPLGLVAADHRAELILEIGQGEILHEPAPPQPSRVERMQAIAGQETLLATVQALDLDKRWQTTPEDSVRRVREHLSLAAGEKENLIVLRYTAATPHEARTIARSIARAYERRVHEAEVARAESVLATMRSELEAQAAKVEEARIRMMALAEEHESDPAAPSPPASDRLEE